MGATVPTYIYMHMHDKELMGRRKSLEKNASPVICCALSVCKKHIVENQRDELNSARKNSTDFTKLITYKSYRINAHLCIRPFFTCNVDVCARNCLRFTLLNCFRFSTKCIPHLPRLRSCPCLFAG